jgi:methionine sulfoxide reductase heme-binding subunit
VTAEALWFLGRGTGVVALVLFSVAVAGGIAVHAARPLFGLPRFAVTLVHRNTTLLALLFLLIHVVTMVADPEAPIALTDALLPFLGEYRPFWLGLGTLSAELVVALIGTSLLRTRIGLRIWRAVHWAAYLAWPFALAHTLGTGTDNATPWLWLVAGGCTALVAGCAAWRFVPEPAPALVEVR